MSRIRVVLVQCLDTQSLNITKKKAHSILSEHVNHTKSADNYRIKAQEERSKFSRARADRIKEEGMIKDLKRRRQELENLISTLESQANSQRTGGTSSSSSSSSSSSAAPGRPVKQKKTEQNVLEEVSDVEETAREINEFNFVSSARRKNEPTVGQIVCYGADRITLGQVTSVMRRSVHIE